VNSVMLYHAVQAGLDMAIVNPAHIKPYAEITPEQRAIAEDLIFNRQDNALKKLITYFEQVVTSDDDQKDKQKEAFKSMHPEERFAVAYPLSGKGRP